MSTTPHKYLKQALQSKITTLGYRTFGSYPRVEVHSFDTTEGDEKANSNFVVTFIIEVVDSSTDSTTSLNMIEAIRAGIDETLTVTGFRVVVLQWELLNEIVEMTDTDLNIYRQIQRVRITLNNN